MTTTPRLRRDDIDWLRVLAMLIVFLYHCGRFFNNEDWHVKNIRTSNAATILLAVIGQWMMPLFFVLSGMSSYYALTHQSIKKYIRSRVSRLLVPLLFGIFVVIAPLEVYLERLSHSQFTGSFWQFYPHYFKGWYGFGGNFAWMGIHLWYLEVLFVYSLILLPLFMYLRSKTGVALLTRTAAALRMPGFILLLAAPIAIMEYVTNIPSIRDTPLGTKAFGGWSLLPYVVFFTIGYIVAAEGRFGAIIEKQRTIGLAAGAAVTSMAFYMIGAGYSVPDWLVAVLRAVNAWAWLVAILGFGSRYLNFSNGFLKYANEAVLPFYILHQTVMLAAGFYITRLDTAIGTKFVVIAAMSLLVIIGLYELLIRRANTLRFLFGMKTLPTACGTT